MAASAVKVVKVAEGLPAKCVVVIPGTGNLGLIRRGECGYLAVETRRVSQRGEAPENAARRLNRLLGVTPAQAAAMIAGSMCGWHVPGADPANYDEDGFLKL